MREMESVSGKTCEKISFIFIDENKLPIRHVFSNYWAKPERWR